MSSPNTLAVHTISAQLYLNPTDPDGTGAALGTPAGDHDDIVFTIQQNGEALTNKFTGDVFEKIITSEFVTLAILLQSFDPDVWSAIRTTDVSTDTLSTTPLVSGDMGIAGRRMSVFAQKILLLPREKDRHQGILLYNASGEITGEGNQFSQQEKWGQVVTFIAFPDSDRKKFRYGQIRDFAGT